MTVLYTAGDLLASDLPALAHGCNCAGAMGKGIAVGFKKQFPAMYESYRTRCKDGLFQPGDVFVWEQNGQTVFNLGTQKTWRTKATLAAIQTAVATMLREAEQRGVDRIGMPRIGAGLGGLEWDDVKKVLDQLAGDHAVLLIVFEDFQPGVPFSGK